MAWGASANALVHQITFTANPGSWEQNFGIGSPFGLPDDPTLTGTIWIDDTTLNGPSSVTDLSYDTGTHSWTAADITDAYFTFGSTATGIVINGVALIFGPAVDRNFLSFSPVGDVNYGSAGVSDALAGDVSNDTIGIYCAHCVTATDLTRDGNGPGAVPEPGAWALLLAGFGLTGAALRRRAYVAG
jgi:hypothetical protein